MSVIMSPAAWLQLLERRLEDRWRRMVIYDAYFEGDHQLAFATTKWREAFGGLFATIADNWMPLVCEATVERLNVQGFRMGSEQDADNEAWAIWQANGLDAESAMAHMEAVKLGEAYWLVEPAEGDDAPRITPEHPSQVIVAMAAGNRRQRLAALKRWWDDDGYVRATLYLPDEIVKFRSQEKARAGRRIKWVRRPGDEGGVNPLGEVPVIPLRNAPSMLGGGQSDLKDAIPLQDALNKLLSDMLIGSEFQAFPQRVLLGQEVPKDPVTGEPLAGFALASSQSRLQVFESPDAKITQFPAADLGTYVNSRQHLIRGLTAKTRTPPHYILGEIVNASGDALTAAETGLVSKTRRKMPSLGEGHEDAIRLSFKAKGDHARAAAFDAETIWADPESRSMGQLVDALQKLQPIGVPNDVLQLRAGFSPQEVERMAPRASTVAASLDDVQAMVAAQVPLETIWQRLGFEPDQVAEMAALRGLPSRSVGATSPAAA